MSHCCCVPAFSRFSRLAALSYDTVTNLVICDPVTSTTPLFLLGDALGDFVRNSDDTLSIDTTTGNGGIIATAKADPQHVFKGEQPHRIELVSRSSNMQTEQVIIALADANLPIGSGFFFSRGFLLRPDNLIRAWPYYGNVPSFPVTDCSVIAVDFNGTSYNLEVDGTVVYTDSMPIYGSLEPKIGFVRSNPSERFDVRANSF